MTARSPNHCGAFSHVAPVGSRRMNFALVLECGTSPFTPFKRLSECYCEPTQTGRFHKATFVKYFKVNDKFKVNNVKYDVTHVSAQAYACHTIAPINSTFTFQIAIGNGQKVDAYMVIGLSLR